jgi:hypothetical protein
VRAVEVIFEEKSKSRTRAVIMDWTRYRKVVAGGRGGEDR